MRKASAFSLFDVSESYLQGHKLHEKKSTDISLLLSPILDTEEILNLVTLQLVQYLLYVH